MGKLQVSAGTPARRPGASSSSQPPRTTATSLSQPAPATTATTTATPAGHDDAGPDMKTAPLLVKILYLLNVKRVSFMMWTMEGDAFYILDPDDFVKAMGNTETMHSLLLKMQRYGMKSNHDYRWFLGNWPYSHPLFTRRTTLAEAARIPEIHAAQAPETSSSGPSAATTTTTTTTIAAAEGKQSDA
jgi:hypothetical protein